MEELEDSKVNYFGEGEKTITIIDDEGNEIVCSVILEFSSDETNKKYVVFSDWSTDENGAIKISAVSYDLGVENPQQQQITTEEEWNAVKTVLDETVGLIREWMDGQENGTANNNGQ